MLRSLVLLVAGTAVQAAIWPELLFEAKRTKLEPVTLEDKAVWEEYGVEAAEQAVYEGAAGKFTARGFRLKDPTSAMAVEQWRSGRTPKPKRIGNYVIEIEGHSLSAKDLDFLTFQFPRLDQGTLPVLPDYIPRASLVNGSERFVLGPVALEKFERRIPVSTAAFSLGAEGQLARFTSPAGELTFALFSYPAPQMARERLVEFQKIPGAVTKRTGPMVAVVLEPKSPDEAEKLLAKINYRPTITWDEKLGRQESNMGDLLIGAFQLVGFVILFIVLAGLAFAGVRIARRRLRPGGEEAEAMIRLDLTE